MTSKNGKVSVGISFTGFLMPVLTILFAAVKLFGIYEMSWLWVFSPIWVPLAITAGLFIVGGLGFLAFIVGAFLFGLAVEAWAKRKARLDRERWRR